MPKLTKTTVEDVRPSEKDVFIWDADIPGFGLRVKPSGARSYLIQYRDAQGRSKRVTIGQHGKITAEQARAEAKRQFARITLFKSDPRSERNELRQAITLEQLAADYLAAVESGTINTRLGKPKAPSTLLVDRGRIANHIVPILGTKAARDLEPRDVMELFSSVAAGRTARSGPSGKPRGRIDVEGGKGTAKKAVTLLSAILSYGVKIGALPSNVALGALVLPKDGQRQLDNPKALLRALGRALAFAKTRGENAKALVGIQLAAVTGMRAQEVINLTWAELDFQNDAIRLADSKTGRSIRPLNASARDLLWHSRMYHTTPYVFPGDRGEGSYGGLPAAVRRVCQASELDEDTRKALAGFSLHIARHAFASIANAEGISDHDIGALLGHARSSITAKYISPIDRHLLGEANKAAGAVASLLEQGARTISKASADGFQDVELVCEDEGGLAVLAFPHS